MTTYDGGLGTTVTVTASDSTTNPEFNTEVALIGSDANGTATTGTRKRLTSIEQAESLFGESSDIAAAYEVATKNGNQDVTALAVDSTAPDYESAVNTLSEEARYVVPLTAVDEDIQASLTGANDAANDLTFTRIIAPGSDSSPGSATPIDTDERLVTVSPTNITVGGTQSFTAVAVAAVAARQPLGNSITYNEVVFDTLSTDYGRAEAQQFDSITAVTQRGVIAEGVTTSDKSAFSDIYAVEIVDAVVAALDRLAQNFAGESPNTPEQRRSLESKVDGLLGPLTQRRPPLLSDVDSGAAFERSVEAISGTQVRLNVAISPVDVMKQIEIALDVGSVVNPVTVQA